MLEQSDNTALKATELTTFNMVAPADSSLNAVDVDLTENADQTISISAREYSSFLTCLYFACYDNYQDSQTILNDLANTSFDNRLTADLPKNIQVAHKIGVHDSDQSDCGIIYVPNKRYVLCVILKGADNDTTNGYIADISKMTYNYIAGK
jgi:beta-lactamase class A